MKRDECYRLLGLRPGATETEIRRQYKRMALKVHPDINPDPRANEQFILLTKAVEILLNPETQTTERSSRKANPAETEAERRERMEQARKRFEQQRARKAQEDISYFQQLTSGIRWRIFRYIIAAGWILALALSLDSVLPSHFEQDGLISYSTNTHNGITYERIAAVNLEKNGLYFMENRRGNWINSYPEVVLEKNWLLHTPILLYTTDDYAVYKTGVDFHIGSIRWLLVFILMIPLLTYLWRRRSLWFVFFYQFSFWGIGGLILYLLLTHNRLVHLLSFGFF